MLSGRRPEGSLPHRPGSAEGRQSRMHLELAGFDVGGRAP
jgi:hypothetical protein